MLGETLRIIRIANDKKITQISLETGISKNYLSEIERGIKNPSLEILKKLCTNYNISFDKLIAFNKFSEDTNLNYSQTLLMILEYYEYEDNKKNKLK